MDKPDVTVQQLRSSIRNDGTRNFVHPADVKGRFDLARKLVFVALIAIYAALPWIKVGGNPAVFLDIEHRRFFLFGATFNAQDVWLLFFLITGVAFGLVYLTAVAGRVWCGWACPQTVFLEGFYRVVERWTEGPRETRIKRNAGPWTVDKVVRKTVKQAIFGVISFAVAHVFLAYFVSLPGLWTMMREKPFAHLEAFAWAAGITGVMWFNFGWFREQMCLVICPYGRLQSALVDPDSITIGYDVGRGEPRGKVHAEGVGDCVDCNRCVVVCPTGIDIRVGLQLDCIACTACIDACDDVMDKLDRPRGLIRYDSMNGLEGKPKRFLRPRLYVYTVLALIGLGVATFSAGTKKDFEANVLRLQGAPYVVEDGTIRNSFELHLVNKRSSSETLRIEPEPVDGVTFVVPIRSVKLEGLAATSAPVFVVAEKAKFAGDFEVRFRVSRDGADAPPVIYRAKFLGPTR